MRERPILMTTESVKPILEGRKSQTRRVIKPQPLDSQLGMMVNGIHFHLGLRDCPFGYIGDRLWVRETYYRFGHWELTGKLTSPGKAEWEFIPESDEVLYIENPPTVIKTKRTEQGWFKRPSIFMPRWASRITLEITGIRVERLQEITEEDAIAEGIIETSHTLPGGKLTAYGEYMLLWDALNAKRGYPWESNPWVWAISFKKLDN